METYYVTENNFGADLPENWGGIADYLNQIIDERGIATDSSACNELWEDFWQGNLEMKPNTACIDADAKEKTMRDILNRLAEYYPCVTPTVTDREGDLEEKFFYWVSEYNDGHAPLEYKEFYRSFVVGLTIGEEMNKFTPEQGQYAIDQWHEEGSIETPPGFSGEIYSALWNEYCDDEPEDDPEQDNESRRFMLKTWTDDIMQVSIKTGREIAEIYRMDQDYDVYSRMEVWDVEGDPKRINLLDLVEPIIDRLIWMEREYRDYCDSNK